MEFRELIFAVCNFSARKLSHSSRAENDARFLFVHFILCRALQ